jgi:hypothetical protein
MRLERAVEILERLRDGEDPRTGRALPAGSPAQEADVVRALYTILAALPPHTGDDPPGDAAEPVAPRRPQPTRAGQPWTDDEDARLGAAFDAGDGVAKLARAFERTASAVRLRLVKLGRLTAEDVLTSRSRRREPEPAAATG